MESWAAAQAAEAAPGAPSSVLISSCFAFDFALISIFGAPRMPPTPLREVFAKFSRIFFENVGAKNFSKNRSRRRDQFGPKIVQIRAILAIFEPFEVWGCQKSRIFERPFTPRGWLRSASNFGKMRFRRSPTFHLSTLVPPSPPKKSNKTEVFDPPWREDYRREVN